MAGKRKTFDLNNPSDIEEVHNILWDKIYCESDVGDQSDTDCEAEVTARDGDSDTEQEDSDEEVEENVNIYYTGKDGITRWNMMKLKQCRRTRAENLLTHLPGFRGPAKNYKTAFECWNVLITEEMLYIIVKFTNKHIDAVKQNFSRERDEKLTDKVEIKSFWAYCIWQAFSAVTD